MSAVTAEARESKPRQELDSVVIRFAGDSGDGVQITGSQFTDTTALAGNDLATFPDFPAEIRAPVGTTFGVSAFQINFGARAIETSGDAPDVLVALNPAALKVNLGDLRDGGLIILDVGAFTSRNYEKAGWTTDPLEDDTLAKYRVVKIDISKMTLESVKEFDVTSKEGLRCKNFWTLGLVYWLYGREREPTIKWLNEKFAKLPTIAEANISALNAGHAFGETAEMGEIGSYVVPPAELEAGEYRNVTGTDAMAWGLTAGTKLAGTNLVFCSYPITPASSLLHSLAGLKNFDVVTFQAEDEIAAVGAALGASYAGSLGITSSSGPGVALKGEAIGLAVMTELPMIIVNSQRAGPSTGMPTKTEQSDLYQSVYGRNGDSPLVVIAARSPADCFEVGIEAVRLATKYMTPVMVLSDTYIVNAAEPWLIPDASSYEPFPVEYREEDSEDFHPYMRDEATLARPWVKPGTPGLEHRIGGLEKAYNSGHISYDPDNHHQMTMVRKNKIEGIANDIPLQDVAQGADSGQLAVVGWGSTYGPISRAVENTRERGLAVSHIHLRHLWPLPRNLGDLLSRFDKVLVPEMNTGQLKTVLRDQYLVPAEGLNRVTGKPFKIAEVEDAINEMLGS